MFTELFPIVTTPDLERSLHFYRDLLGGTVTHEFPGLDGTLVYVGIDVGSNHMGVGLVPGLTESSTKPVSLWVYADDCDRAVDRLRAHGVRVTEEPRDQPWGERVARVLDPDGNEIIIGQRMADASDTPEGLGASLISPEPERYTRREYERRFLVSPGSAWRDLVEPYSKTFDDLYIRRTFLRLRTLTDSATGREFIKLTKKLRSDSPYVQLTGSIPLSPMEYEFISGLEGDRLSKVRYYHFHAGNVFSVDVFQGELEGLVMCEVECGGLEELMRIEPPAYAPIEVTEDDFFGGGNLSRISRRDLTVKLTTMDGAGPAGALEG